VIFFHDTKFSIDAKTSFSIYNRPFG